MWIPGIEPGHEVLQTSALPSELNPRSAANGSRTHDLPVDNRTLVPLSYGDEIGHQVFKEPATSNSLLPPERRVEDLNLRDPFLSHPR
jgi:hypothetical protein